jgi:hypothetical protein
VKSKKCKPKDYGFFRVMMDHVASSAYGFGSTCSKVLRKDGRPVYRFRSGNRSVDVLPSGEPGLAFIVDRDRHVGEVVQYDSEHIRDEVVKGLGKKVRR